MIGEGLERPAPGTGVLPVDRQLTGRRLELNRRPDRQPTVADRPLQHRPLHGQLPGIITRDRAHPQPELTAVRLDPNHVIDPAGCGAGRRTRVEGARVPRDRSVRQHRVRGVALIGDAELLLRVVARRALAGGGDRVQLVPVGAGDLIPVILEEPHRLRALDLRDERVHLALEGLPPRPLRRVARIPAGQLGAPVALHHLEVARRTGDLRRLVAARVPSVRELG